MEQGPAGQRCVHEAHEAHEAHVAHIAHLAHLAHPAHQAHSAMSMLDCPNDFRIENGSFSAFKKNGLPTDHRTNQPTDKTSYRDARTDLKINFSPTVIFKKYISPSFDHSF